MKALDKDRRQRYETANSLAMELRRFLNDETVLADNHRAFVKKFVKWNRGLVASVSAIIGFIDHWDYRHQFRYGLGMNESGGQPRNQRRR